MAGLGATNNLLAATLAQQQQQQRAAAAGQVPRPLGPQAGLLAGMQAVGAPQSDPIQTLQVGAPVFYWPCCYGCGLASDLASLDASGGVVLLVYNG